MMRGIAFLFITVAGLNSLAQGSSTFKVNPATPVVIDGNFQTASGKTVLAPWFQSQFAFFTTDATPVTIVSLRFDVTNKSTGQKQSVTVTPSDYNFQVNCLGGGTATVSYVSFGSLNASGQTLGLVSQNSGVLQMTCTGTPAIPGPGFDQDLVNIMVGYLPLRSGSDVGYNVELHLIGWTGTYDQPIARYENVIQFSAL